MRPEALNYVCFVLQCAVGTWRYLDNHLMEGQLVAFLASSVALQLPLNLLFGVGAMPSQAKASLIRLVGLLNTQTTTPDPAPEASRTLPLRASVSLSQVSFAYNLSGQPILKTLA
jgi:ABC-type bacteriocin/lantibiotic exporter with double-glycine peptidase domain